MWKSIEQHFSRRSAGRQVVEAFLRYGLSVRTDGSVYCGPFEMAPAKIGRALNVDRRVVIATAKQIAGHEDLLSIFSKLQPRACIGGAAAKLGFDTIEISADARASGIVSDVTRILSSHKLIIRQIIADDPDLFPEPKLLIVVGGRLPVKALQELRKLPFAEKIAIS
ncbi:Uncharacterised protein [uncultured archaeon]|nr:Uncharacterised protein [uncultured archaeon]